MVDHSEGLGEGIGKLSDAPRHDSVVASPEGLGEGSGNSHNSPNWFHDMTTSYQVCILHSAKICFISNIKESVVAACTKRTRDAIAANEDIEDVAERRVVQMEILNATVTYLEGVFGTDTPSTS